MKAKAPNYLYPLATQRQLQWTKDVVKGESSAKRPTVIKESNPVKKEIIKDLIKKKTINKTVKTRNFLGNISHNLPIGIMRAQDPRPGNATHITNTMAMYGNQN